MTLRPRSPGSHTCRAGIVPVSHRLTEIVSSAGLAAKLDREGIGQTAVVGGSAGGMIGHAASGANALEAIAAVVRTA